ncbi:MAG TPA: sensor histidine kinase, partial [Candidatus Caenarcaniphilales bacterium]
VSDRAILGRILAELLNNACKYTPAGGRIILSVRYDVSPPVPTPSKFGEDTFRFIAVSSLGANNSASSASPVTTFTLRNQAEIPAVELPRIFEKFYRIPNADPWKQGGTGLGLTLVQKLVKQLQGSIQVESRAQQTTFSIRLPNQDPRQDTLSPKSKLGSFPQYF